MKLGDRTRAFAPYVAGNLYFSIGVSTVSGLSNTAASYWSKNLGAAESTVDFFHAFGGNFAFGLVVNFIPATFNQKFRDSAHFWLTGNLMMLGMNAFMLGAQYLIEVENPIESRFVPTLVSQALENLLIVRSIRSRRGRAA